MQGKKDHLTHGEIQEVFLYGMKGFAVKFYTEEGNWDMTGNNTPIFFIRDLLNFPISFIRRRKTPGQISPISFNLEFLELNLRVNSSSFLPGE